MENGYTNYHLSMGHARRNPQGQHLDWQSKRAILIDFQSVGSLTHPTLLLERSLTHGCYCGISYEGNEIIVVIYLDRIDGCCNAESSV